MGSEWNNKTVYGWLSLPARGSVLLGSKTLALFTQALVLGAVPVLTAWILIHQPGVLASFGAPVPDARTTRMILEAGSKIGVMAVLGVLDLAALAQLSSVAGKTVHRLQWLVSGGVFFGLLWLGGRLLGPLVDALWFLGSFPLVSGLNQPGSGGTAAASTQQFPVAVPVLEVLGFVVLFLAAAWVLEKRAEA
ncbi:MAG: hypothetical protein IMW99_07455 [Firmicutes bacterium]|nr:hypothetical protein [Bacillota bacterium]